MDKLEDRVQDLIDFIESGWDVVEPDLEPLPAESTASRINLIVGLTLSVVPRVIDLTTGDLLDLGMQGEVRRDLFVMRQMIRSLQD